MKHKKYLLILIAVIIGAGTVLIIGKELSSKDSLAQIVKAPAVSGTRTTVSTEKKSSVVNPDASTSTTSTTDVCPNIEGTQVVVPAGYSIFGGQCLKMVRGTLVASEGKPDLPSFPKVAPGFYLMAGHDNSQMYNDFWKMNPTTAAWTNITQNAPWSRREYSESVYFNGKIYLMGGVDATGYLNDVWAYDGSTWTQVSQHAPWVGRGRFASVVWNNEIWIMGGRTGIGYGSTNDIWKSADGIHWTQVTTIGTMWAERNGFEAVLYNNNLWVMGGVGNIAAGQYYKDVWKSPDGIHWAQVTQAASWDDRTLFGLSVYSNKLWVIGGFYPHGRNGHLDNDAWVSSDGLTWSQAFSNIWPAKTTTNGSHTYTTSGRREITTAVFNNKIWAMAGSFITTLGEGDEHFYNDVWTYDGTSWSQVDADPTIPGTSNAPWSARDGLTSVYVP